MQLTVAHLTDVRNRFNNAAGTLSNKNQMAEIRDALEEVKYLLDQFEKKGHFDDDSRMGSIYFRGEQESVDLESQRDVVFHVRTTLARHALEIKQHFVGELTALADEALRLAGREAAKAVCQPTKNHADKMIPSRYTLPEGFESLVGKLKAVLAQ